MATHKKWYESKTIWFNIISTVVGAGTVILDILPPQYDPYVILVVGLANIILRVWWTDKPISGKIK